jgi:hypothetical protein
MRRTLLGSLALGLTFATTLTCAPRTARTTAAPELWFYQSLSIADTGALPRTEALWRRAAAAGYSRVVLADARFARPSAQDAAYLANVATLRALADSLGLQVVPGICTLGREDGALLAEDPDLAEALPVRGAKFVAQGGIARLVADPPLALPATIPVLEGAATQSGGMLSMRALAGRARAGAELTIAPWRVYHVRVAIRTQDWRGDAQLRVTGDGRELAFARVRPEPAQDWATYDAVFYSQAHTRVRISLGDWHPRGGTIEWRDWRIDEAGPVNLVRRPDTPFTFEGLREGRDFEPVRDTLMGNSPWRGQFNVWHEPPVIHVHAKDGTVLRASWWGAAVVYAHQVAACASDSAVLRRYAQEGPRVRQLFGARTVMIMHDEVRALGGDPACVRAGGDAGKLLAANVRAAQAGARPSETCIWNDMFDPAQNAVPDYHLVTSDLSRAADGLDSSITIVNWNLPKLEASLRFFAARGHAQVIAAYYDGRVEDSRAWLPLLARVPRIRAVMYTTWQERYDDLERFATLVRSAR